MKIDNDKILILGAGGVGMEIAEFIEIISINSEFGNFTPDFENKFLITNIDIDIASSISSRLKPLETHI
jgi:hypothetical protein